MKQIIKSSSMSLLVLTCLAFEASAEYTAGDLASQCRLPIGSGQLFCAGYLAGAMEAHRLYQQESPQASLICTPALKPDQRKKIFLDWMKKTAGAAKLSPQIAVYKAFSEKFPCD